MKTDPLETIETITRQTNDFMGKTTGSALSRYPLLFTLLTVFGFVSIVYGFEAFINKITFLSERPLLVFAIGIAILVFTGSLYKVLNKHNG